MTLEVALQLAVDAAGVPTLGQIERWASAAWQEPEASVGVVVRVVGVDEGRALNHQFRHQDKPTNVLSFPYEPLPGGGVHHVGDLVICAPVVAREAAEQGKSGDAHWAHMVVHGMLHLQGYDHLDAKQAERMESLETIILESLGFPAPYAIDEMQ